MPAAACLRLVSDRRKQARKCGPADGTPLTYRRYDHLWQRIGEHLPWVAVQQISTHWLRHTTLTWVERYFGNAAARARLRLGTSAAL